MALGLVTCLVCVTAVLYYKGNDMGILDSLFSKRENSSEKEVKITSNLAFVLLSEVQLPDAEAVVRAFRDFAAPDENLQNEMDDSGKTESDQSISLKLNSGEKSIVVLMPVAVPNDEADQGAQFSLSSFRNQWKLPPHCAHLVVTFNTTTESSPIVRLSRFTSLVAAVTKVSPAVGVYWGSAGATHDAEFFVSVASEQDVISRMMLWSGVSIAREEDGRLSLLSLGMDQLNLPNLLLVAGESSESVALETMFDLLAYVAERGKALPKGNTVGRTVDEKLPVHYVPSPVGESKKVWRVELP